MKNKKIIILVVLILFVFGVIFGVFYSLNSTSKNRELNKRIIQTTDTSEIISTKEEDDFYTIEETNSNSSTEEEVLTSTESTNKIEEETKNKDSESTEEIEAEGTFENLTEEEQRKKYEETRKNNGTIRKMTTIELDKKLNVPIDKIDWKDVYMTESTYKEWSSTIFPYYLDTAYTMEIDKRNQVINVIVRGDSEKTQQVDEKLRPTIQKSLSNSVFKEDEYNIKFEPMF